MTEPTCKGCYWWAALDEREFLGLCGHQKGPDRATDVLDTCEHHEPKEAAESYLA